MKLYVLKPAAIEFDYHMCILLFTISGYEVSLMQTLLLLLYISLTIIAVGRPHYLYRMISIIWQNLISQVKDKELFQATH
jgi:hypothetical protein